jgi:hypothetical protein
VNIKIKAFIYRFSNIFGLYIYLAQKEEDKFIKGQKFDSKLGEDISRGAWQANKGFTTIWTYRQPIHRGILNKIKHAFDF